MHIVCATSCLGLRFPQEDIYFIIMEIKLHASPELPQWYFGTLHSVTNANEMFCTIFLPGTLWLHYDVTNTTPLIHDENESAEVGSTLIWHCDHSSWEFLFWTGNSKGWTITIFNHLLVLFRIPNCDLEKRFVGKEQSPVCHFAEFKCQDQLRFLWNWEVLSLWNAHEGKT